MFPLIQKDNQITYRSPNEKEPYIYRRRHTFYMDADECVCCFYCPYCKERFISKWFESSDNETNPFESLPNIFGTVLVCPDCYGQIMGKRWINKQQMLLSNEVDDDKWRK